MTWCQHYFYLWWFHLCQTMWWKSQMKWLVKYLLTAGIKIMRMLDMKEREKISHWLHCFTDFIRIKFVNNWFRSGDTSINELDHHFFLTKVQIFSCIINDINHDRIWNGPTHFCILIEVQVFLSHVRGCLLSLYITPQGILNGRRLTTNYSLHLTREKALGKTCILEVM